MNQNTQRWMELPAYQELMRQVHTDIYVGCKNGFNKDCEEALNDLADVIKRSVHWDLKFAGPKKTFKTKVVKCPNCKGKGEVPLPPAYPRFHTYYENCPDCDGKGKVAA